MSTTQKTENKKNSITVIQLSNYNAPKITEAVGNKYVFYGNKNQYFSYLEECYNGSPTNRAIISSITTLMYGKGLEATDSQKSPLQWAALKKLFKPKDLRLILKDYYKKGQACFQVGYTSDKKRVIKTQHTPVETIAKGKKNKQGVTEMYYFSPNWRSTAEVTPIPAFGYGTEEDQVELYYIDGDASIVKYFSDVVYQAGLQYCKMEEEVSNFHINNIQNGFTPSMLINFNNGIPKTEELQAEIEQDVQDKWGGTSNAGKVVISFNKSSANAPTLEAVQLSDADKQYEFVSKESTEKIMVSHKVVSPMLLGLATANGFSSNTEELRTSYMLFNVSVIQPLQEPILEAIDAIAAINGSIFDIYFTPLMPVEFIEGGIEATTDEDAVVKETGITLSDETMVTVLEAYGSVEDESLTDYELFLEEDAGDEDESANMESILNTVALASTQNSEQDSDMFKVRYTYAKGTSKNPSGGSRTFCTSMLALAATGRRYRKEDIVAMGEAGVNKDFGLAGQPYSIWLYKGGENCYHAWTRQTYKKKVNADGEPLGGNPMQNVYPVNDGSSLVNGVPLPVNSTLVSTAPIDMPNSGSIT